MNYPLPPYSRFSLFVILSVFLALFGLGVWKTLMELASSGVGFDGAGEKFARMMGFISLFGSVIWIPIVIAGFVPGYWAFFRVFLLVFALTNKYILAVLMAAIVTSIVGWIVPVALMKIFGHLGHHRLGISDFLFLLYFGIPAALISASITLIPREKT